MRENPVTNISFSFHVTHKQSGGLLEEWYIRCTTAPYFSPDRFLTMATELFRVKLRTNLPHLKPEHMSPISFTIHMKDKRTPLHDFDSYAKFVYDGTISLGVEADYSGSAERWAFVRGQPNFGIPHLPITASQTATPSESETGHYGETSTVSMEAAVSTSTPAKSAQWKLEEFLSLSVQFIC
jgi:hypothetical protein